MEPPTWQGLETASEWIQQVDVEKAKKDFEENGFLVRTIIVFPPNKIWKLGH